MTDSNNLPDDKLELARAIERLCAELQVDIDLSMTRDQHIRASQRLELAKWILVKAGVVEA